MSSSDTRLNFLWIYGEDLSPDLGCYGDRVVHTPNVDRLAAEGALYRHAYVTCPVCSPSRSAIITGAYQTSFGAHHHRSKRDTPLPDSMRLITDCFRDAGYFTCNSPGPPYERKGKTDFNFFFGSPFDGIDWREREPGQPFYAQFNIPDTHRVFRRDPEHPTDPNEVQLPPYYPDHTVARMDWALYLDSIQRLDRKLGLILDRLDEEGLADSTVVFFLADHGRGHIRDKQFLYDGGTHIPLIIRWPGVIEPGTIVEDLISAIDLAPTTLSLAGIEPPQFMQGQVFLGDQAAQPRDRVFSAGDRCDGTEDRKRAVRTARYKYIRNYWPERAYTQFNGYKTVHYPMLPLCAMLYAAGELEEYQRPFMAPFRPAEELYDLEADPFELHNLADDPDHESTLCELRASVETWIAETGDCGEQPEDPDVVRREVDQMMDHYYRDMKERGLAPDVCHADYVAWWEQELTRRLRIE